ncbi:MAG TPA: amidohydrolase family protein [Clostridia bacterium]|nr:amidohydrolase family protein [Clostridia bacterium]
MVIDVHTHPVFFNDISGDSERLLYRKLQYGLYKGRPHPMDLVMTQMDYAGIDKMVLLPEDLTSINGGIPISNEEIKKLVDLKPDRFIGFASVDPHRTDAVEVLDHAFKDLGLMGLKLNPSKQKFYPDEELLTPIYKKCLEYNKPILFHAGMSWEPDAPSKYARPINFEDVAMNYPELRICLAHFGWPWMHETVMLLLKYPNVYTDTAMLYMDSPKDFYDQLFMRNMGPQWINRNMHSQILFGSNGPRFGAQDLKKAIEELDLRPFVKKKILGENAMKFIGLEG